MLSPVDIQNKEFRKAKIGGYHVEEVNDFLDEVLEAYQQITKENFELKDKVNMLNENIQYYRTMEATIQNALVLAEKTAQDTKTLAYEKADQIKKEAEQKAEGIIDQAKKDVYHLTQEAEDLKKHYQSIKIQVRQLLQGQLEIVEKHQIAHAELPIKEREVTFEVVPEPVPDMVGDAEDFYTKEFKVIDHAE
ncbi:MAG: DivIVA domain-containing protein [Cellulosilyticaceae bacterium]